MYSQSKNVSSYFEMLSSSLYEKLLERISECAWLMDVKGQIYLGNSSWQEYTGKVASLSLPYAVEDFVSLEDKLLLKNILKTIEFQENILERQIKFKNYRGENSLFDLKIERINLENKDNCAILLCSAAKIESTVEKLSIELNIKSNIPSYKQKESALILEPEFIRRILESSKDCIKVLDLEGRLLYMNDGGQGVMEIDDFDRQVQYAPWLSFWQGCDRALAERAFADASAGKIGKFEGYCTTAKGTPKWWEVVVTPMFDENNLVREILSVSRDITSRKFAEEEINRRNQDLEKFAYIVSHDLKAPLRGISSLSQMISEDLQEQIPTENRHQLELMQQRVSRMNALIDGLLNYSRVGRQEIPIESVNLEDLILEIIDSLAPPKSFKIVYKKPLPTLATKKLLLNQIMTNLISNAIKHHHLDSGQIELTVKDCDRYYDFAIADDGPGIPEPHRERIFEIFQTLENNASTTNTGIGLALIKKIVDSEGGKFWLDSQTKTGAKFCFTWKKN